MSGGTTTCTIPDDVEVDVDFYSENGDVILDSAGIGMGILDLDGIKIGELTLRSYLQAQLDERSEELINDCNERDLEARSDERAGR